MPRKTFTFEGRRYDVTAKTEAELYEKVAQKKLELEQGQIRESRQFVKDYVKVWLSVYKKPYVSVRTYEMYITTTNHIIRYLGDMQIKHVSPTDVQRMITNEFEKGRSKSHIDKLLLTMRQIFRQAKMDKKIRDNPLDGIATPKMQQRSRRAITEEERRYILSVAATHRYGRWIRGMLYLGIRPEETALLQGKDVDLKSQTLHVRGTKSKKADRYVPIPDALLSDFTGFSDEEYIYTTSKGNPPDKRRRHAWWGAFKRDLDIAMGAEVYRNQILKSVVADDLTAYCLRHTYGTDGQAAGIPIDVLADLMGHEDVSTTRKYYIHDNSESRNAAKKAFERLYKQRDKNTQNNLHV